MVAPGEIVQCVIDTYRQAAEACRQTRTREGNIIALAPDAAGDVMIAGDLHGNRLNYHRLCRIADLRSNVRRHLVLQEVCHGGPTYPASFGCMSHLLLEDVAALKVRYPDRVHFLLSNHELAELNDHLIAKGGRMLNMQFRAGLQEIYGRAGDAVRDALVAFLSACPLAVRLENGVFISHGIPEQVDRRGFDTGVFQRALAPRDLEPDGEAFRLVWGRDFRPENAEAFASLVGAGLLVHGHEPCREGFAVPNDRQIVLDCAGRRAAYAIMPVGRAVTHAEATTLVRLLHGGG